MQNKKKSQVYHCMHSDTFHCALCAQWYKKQKQQNQKKKKKCCYSEYPTRFKVFYN